MLADGVPSEAISLGSDVGSSAAAVHGAGSGTCVGEAR
jgi:hypothetical protein